MNLGHNLLHDLDRAIAYTSHTVQIMELNIDRLRVSHDQSHGAKEALRRQGSALIPVQGRLYLYQGLRKAVADIVREKK